MVDVEYPETLFERVRAGHCILCTGLRFASTAGMPAWDDLFGQMRAKLGADDATIARLIEEQKLLIVAGYLKRKLGLDSCASLLKEAYGRGADLPDSYKILQDIPFHGAISTGYDALVEKALAHNGSSPQVFTYADGAVLRLSEDLKNYVIKAHGDVAHSTPLVLDRVDYKRVISPNQAYRAFIEDLYRTRTLLIVGYHLADPDLTLFLERLVSTFRDAITDHYALLPDATGPEAEELYANYRIRVIPYEEKDDPAQALTRALSQLRDQWRSKGVALPGPEDPAQQIQWLRQQLTPVDTRIDVVATEGLELTDARLDGIRTSTTHLELSDLDPDSLCRLGNVALYFGDAARAMACYQAALAQSTSMAIAHLNLHHAYAEEKKFDKALEHLKKATSLDSTLRTVPERYELTKVIGRGTTGTIYEAKDTQTQKEVTVKVLRTRYVREHVSPQRWQKETEELKKLEHPNLARVYEALLESGRCILITEFLKGRSLSALLRQEGPVTPERAVEILKPACEGLRYAHEKGFLHLDLTPSNIFLREDGTIAVMDFRTGRVHRGRYITDRGAEGFHAPEILAGVGGDLRSDIYSLGAILYYMLTGKLPIGSFQRISEINPAARRFDPLIHRALRANIAERPQTIEEFVTALASGAEAVVIPEREDDLEGWLEVLAYQPDHEKARANIQQLEKRYREDTDWENLVTLLLGRVEYEPDGELRIKLLREVAQIFEKEVGDLGKAFAALQAAFRENSSNVEIRKDLERLAGATGMWNELLQEYTQQVQTLRDPKVACDWWVRMGHLYSNELGHDDYAMASLNQALALDTNRLDALSELAEVLKRKGMHQEYAQTLSRQCDLEEDTARKIELLKELSRTYAKDLESDDEAMATCRQLLELEPAHSPSIAALSALYQKGEMWEELAQLLRSTIEKLDERKETKETKVLRHRLAELLRQQLDSPQEAIKQYQQLLAQDANDLTALKGLEQLYDTTGRHQDYLKILEQRIASAETDEEKISLCRRMAAEWEAQPEGKKKAAEYLEKIESLGGATEELFRDLVRLFWETKDYSKLAEAYQRQIKLTQAPADRTILYAALGKVYEDHLADDSKALDAFNSLFAIDPENKIALAALARLYEKRKEWSQAVKMLEALATKEESVDKQVEIFYHKGLLLREQLKKDDEAEISLVKALELKDTHVDSLLALSDLHREHKDFGKAARLMREAALSTTNELDKVKRLYQAGVTYHDDLRDEEKSCGIFAEVLTLDPEHVSGGERLVGIYEKSEQWSKAVPLLEMLLRKNDARERGRLIELNYRLGQATLALKNTERALAAFRAAYDMDPTHQPVLAQLAMLLYQKEEYEEAGKLFQSLLVHRRDAMKTEEIVDVFYRLGDIKERQGEKNKALNMYEKAMDVDPASQKVLDRAISLYEEKGDFESILRCQRSLLKKTTDEEHRLQLTEDIGDLLHEKLNRAGEALSTYRSVIELKPDQRRVLNKIMEIYIEQHKWDEAIATMGKIEDYETDPIHRARLHYTAAVIFRDELHRPVDAAWHFDQALVKDPTQRRAFDALKDLYTKQKNFKGLAKAYRLMLQRLPESTPKSEQVQLWIELGEICQNKLQDFLGAIVAFEVAAKLDPTNEARQENLALLYTAAGPDAYDKAINAHQRLLSNNPLRLQTYKELRRLYGEMGQRDREWCVAAVLASLKKANSEEMALYHKHRSEQPRKVSRKLADDLWQSLYHPDQLPILNTVFSSVSAVVTPLAARSPKSWGLKDSELLEVENDTRVYAKVLSYIGQVLNHAPRQVYIRRELKEQFSLLLAGSKESATTILAVSPTLIKSESETELCFWFTKALALLRPEHALVFATPSATVLRAVILATLKLVRPAARMSGDIEEILRLSELLRNELPPGQFDTLIEHTDHIREAAGEGKVEQWMRGVNYSITRAALLLCDDMETAARLLSIESHATDQQQAKEKLRELMSFAVSEPYFKLREQLGLQIK